jgi:predicted transcriptional regulator
MKQEFLDFLNALIEAAPDVADKLMTDNVKSYISILNDIDDTKPILTENGKIILNFMQNYEDHKTWKAKDISEQIGLSSRGASGTLRKLVNDGFCEKLGKDPAYYTLTEKGKNFIIE